MIKAKLRLQGQQEISICKEIINTFSERKPKTSQLTQKISSGENKQYFLFNTHFSHEMLIETNLFKVTIYLLLYFKI